MRQLSFAALVGLVGGLLAVPVVAWLASGESSVSGPALSGVAMLPIFGVAAGTYLAHRSAPAACPWPVESLAARVPFMVLGAVLGALGAYLGYAQMAAVWYDLQFMTLVMDPSQLPVLGQESRYGGRSVEQPVWAYMIGYTLVGGWVTGEAIKARWTSD